MSRISLAEVLPRELSASIAPECLRARARIESARSGAQEDFFEARRQDPPTGFSTYSHDFYAFLNYVVIVWFTLNHELCELGRRPKWRHVLPSDHIRLRSEQFLEAFTILIAHPEDGRNRYDQPFEHVVERYAGPSTLSLRFQKELEKHELWLEGKKEQRKVADHQGGKPKKRITPYLAGLEKTYRTELGRNLKRLCDDCGWSLKTLAETAKVDEREVTRHTSGGQNAGKGKMGRYAEAFTKELGRTVTMEELTTWPPKRVIRP